MSAIAVLKSALRPLRAVTHAMGIVMSTILLTILWGIGLGVYATIFKIIRLARPSGAPASTWVLHARASDDIREPF